jgi:hypothetical protein
MIEVEEWWSRVLTMKSSNYKYPAEINPLDVIAQGIEDGRFSYDSVTDILRLFRMAKGSKLPMTVSFSLVRQGQNTRTRHVVPQPRFSFSLADRTSSCLCERCRQNMRSLWALA